MTFILNRLTIKGRLALMSVVFAVGLAVIGGAYLIGSWNVAAAFADASAYADLQVKAGHIAETAVGLKGVARDVRYRHETTELKKLANGLAELTGLVDALAA